MNRKLLAGTLRNLAELIEDSDDREYALLVELGLCGISKGPASSKEKRKPTPRRSDWLIDSAIESLKFVRTRESAFEVLERSELSRLDLQALAKRLDLHVMREDTVHRLMEKIVESSVGARLNSEAIRGEGLRSAS
jgi:hypothetical protein